MKEIFGILAVIIGIGAGIPYVYSILKKKTHPHRVSWAIWASLGIVTLTSYISKGAHWSALLAVAAAFNNIIIFIFSIKFGTGGTSKRDRLALGLGIAGVVLWAITKQATFALVFALSADAIGTILTAEKAYKLPKSENTLTWVMAAFASLFGLLAVQSYTFSQTIYPAYALAGGASLALITFLRRTYIKPPSKHYPTVH